MKLICTLTLRALLALSAALLVAPRISADVWFVRSPPWVGGDGTSWGTAFDSLQAAIAAAAPGDEIRIAAGLYQPGATRGDRFLVQELTLIGSFPAAGGPVADWTLHPTVLSGDIGSAGDPTDDSFNVVFAASSTLDGFVIQNGNADGAPLPGSALQGGGLFCTGEMVLRRCRFTGNRAASGGGVYFRSILESDELLVADCIFDANHAEGATVSGYGSGGGLLAEGSQGQFLGTLNIERASFLGNEALGTGGGASSKITTVVRNSVFSGNHANGPGGGLDRIAGPGGGILNCTFASNRTNYPLGGGGAAVTHVFVANSILHDNTAVGGAARDQQLLESLTTVGFTNTEGGTFPGAGNLSVEPKFVARLGADGVSGTLDDDLRLSLTSACRDAGTNAQAALPVDRDGGARIRRSTYLSALRVVDMGAYEHSVRTIRPAVGP
jgi:hypothetical protein